MSVEDDKPDSFSNLKEGKDYYVENGNYVFSASYHKRRGYCCGSGCRHCPYQVEIPEDKEAKGLWAWVKRLAGW